MPYDVTIITVRPGTPPDALIGIEQWLKTTPRKGEFLACLSSEIGALNQILLLHDYGSDADLADDRERIARSGAAYGIADLITGVTTDTYTSFPFIERMRPGHHGPIFEVRTYTFRPNGLAATIDLWREAVPARVKLSPLLAAMYSTTGAVTRFMHIWPYPSLDERARIRNHAIETGVWPPRGGPGLLVSQQTDIYLPAPYSPMR
jgi:hypothetical protein